MRMSTTEPFDLSTWTPSQLTVARPDIWERGLALAHGITGVEYVDKRPLADGTIFACGGYAPPRNPTLRDILREKKSNLERMRQNPRYWSPRQIDEAEAEYEELKRRYIPTIDEKIQEQEEVVRKKKDNPYDYSPASIDRSEEQLERLKREKANLSSSISVYIPSGAMEWLLHEVGHWVAASKDERFLPNYGNPGDDSTREIEAWAFEEMVLSHLGAARYFAPLSQRDGIAFELSGPLPQTAFMHVERRLRDGNISVKPFQILWEEWVAWGRAQGSEAPWLN